VKTFRRLVKNFRGWWRKLGETILKLGKIFTNVCMLGMCNILLKF
jgi:hypothetical protein